MSAENEVVLFDPAEARVGRAWGTNYEDEQERIVTTWEGGDWSVEMHVLPDAHMSYVMAVLNALGFPEGDLEYLADRFNREFK